jgi:hypothetical protein
LAHENTWLMKVLGKFAGAAEACLSKLAIKQTRPPAEYDARRGLALPGY